MLLELMEEVVHIYIKQINNKSIGIKCKFSNCNRSTCNASITFVAVNR
jgi:acyl-CoA thioesterase FadM